MNRTRALRAASSIASLALMALLPSCGGNKSNPTTPTAGTSPTPAPSSSPTPTPTPTPGGGTSAYPRSCQSLPPATGTPRCSRGNPNFINQVKDAVYLAQGSSYRDPNSGETIAIVDGNKIKAASAYIQTIVDTLDRQGICAVFDGEELNVRDGGGYNENYDITTADGGSWINYNVTCNPAQALPPLPTRPAQADPTCALPASRELFCGKDPSEYDGDVWGAQDAVIAADRAKATPQIFNFNDKYNGSLDYSYKIINDALYVQEMLKAIRARGYCAMYDGDEFRVKRKTNTFSEQFDMTKSEGYAIRLFNSTCRDAAF